jgi:formylglycine-generating enzyme required for sulfatase activity
MAIDPKRVKEIFLEAADLSDEAARAAYLDKACGADAGVRERVEALLCSHDPDGSFLGTPAAVVPDPGHAQSGIIAGTPMYMAPEQALGETLDQRADLFSLGSVLYQMVAGRPPFRASTAVAVLKRVAEDQPRAIREIISETPQWLCDIIAKLHAKNPDDRYQSAREVADVLADCEAQLKANAKLKDYSRIPRSRPQRSGRRKWVAAVSAALLLALLASWFGRAALLYFRDRGELELLPEAGLVSVIVLQNNEGVLDGNKLHAPVTDWLDMKKTQILNLPPGQYQLNVGTWPADTHVSQWEVTTSGPLGSNEVTVPVIDSSAIVTVERGRRVTLRAKTRADPLRPAPFTDTAFDAKQTQEASAKQLGILVETTNSIGMKLRLIPPGNFTMGLSPEEIAAALKLARKDDWEYDRLPTEGPLHEVEITQPFYVSVTEVTVGRFRQFVQESKYNVGDDRWKMLGLDQFDDYPVGFVSWDNAIAFCDWLSKKEGKQYRLPTEAEWEYSCRAGKSGTQYCFGDDEAKLEDYCWYNKNSGGRTKPVGKKKPNDWGLYDMHGNAWEWRKDNYDPNYYKTIPPQDPPGPGTLDRRVIRGGSGYLAPVYCRSACRSHFPHNDRHDYVGFRVVLVVSPPAGARTESGTKDKLSSTAIVPFTDADVQRIAALPAAEQIQEVRKELMRRNPAFNGKMEHKIGDGIVTEFRIVTDKVTDIAPIRVWSTLRVLECRGTFTDNPNGLLADLTPLGGMNLAGLTHLNLINTRVTGAGMAYFKDCKALTRLCLAGTKVSDAGLVHFKGMPLMMSWIQNTGITDLTPLQGMPLEDIRLTPKDITRGLNILRDMKSLKTIGIEWNQDWPAAEFWERYDKGEFK